MTVYTSQEAAELLKIHDKWGAKRINKLCAQGKIRAVKPSNKQGWRIHEKAIEDYLLLK